MKAETVEVRLTAAQIYYLKRRYGTRKGAQRLVRLAIIEAVHEAAKQHLAELGNDSTDK